MKIGLIPAAGLATRLGITTPKELIHYQGQAIIDYSIDHLIDARVDRIVIVIRQGKEAIQEHVTHKYHDFPFQFVYQDGKIGRLIDAIKASYSAISQHQVYFCMADTRITPNPFLLNPTHELTLLCFQAPGETWQHFGVIDPQNHQIIDKPSAYISSICWGALIWQPAFTERLMAQHDLTQAMNDAHWEHQICIESYKDIGIKPDSATRKTKAAQ